MLTVIFGPDGARGSGLWFPGANTLIAAAVDRVRDEGRVNAVQNPFV